MDATIALMLIEALLIVLGIAIRFISPPLDHVIHPVGIGNCCKNAVVSISTVSSPSSHIVVSPPATKYDVFLSFRGEDTRDHFASYLYEALCNANIQTFMDHKLRKGDQISPVLLKTIEESEISVIIFSKDYASSTWCMDELVHVLECRDHYGRIVIPIFYNLVPSDIRKQRGSFGDGFAKLKQRFEDNQDKVQKWRNALIQSTSLSGWDSKNIKPEPKLIKEIVKDILSKLNGTSSCHVEGLVGINHQIQKIEELLIEVRILGIWGMGGIGKTTLAKAVFHKLKVQFEAFSFVESVREQLAQIGLDSLQEKCLKELLKDEDINIYNIQSPFVRRSLQRKKILLILDDVDDLITAKDLTKLCDWFGKGSRITITSRDMQVLKNASASTTYLVQKLDFCHALRLFSLNAFKHNEPFTSYLDLSQWVVGYCQGNPLALIVLGRFLYERGKEEWESAVEKLKHLPHTDIFNVLKLSFDGLDENQKNIFLDLAYFLRETIKISLDFVRGFYDSCAYIDIRVLEDRSLISIDEFGGIKMHDLVKEMGYEISRQQLVSNPEKPIRLWRHKDIYCFFVNNRGSETIRCISLDMCKTKKMILPSSAFEKMYDLKFLKFYKSDLKEPSKVYIFESLDNLPEELRFFFWEEYPLPSVPLSFCAENLMELGMPNNHLQQLWDGDQHFPNLRIIDVNGSKNLIELPNLSQAPNIRRIYLDDCVKLSQMNSSSTLGKLCLLSIRDCKEMRHINLGGKIKDRSSGLVVVYNFLDLVDFTFHKFTVKLFVSDNGIIFSGFRIRLVSVLISECMDDIESAKLEVSSFFPFITVLRWLDVPIEFGNFNKHFDYLSHHGEITMQQSKDVINELIVTARDPMVLEEKIVKQEVRDHSSDYEKGRPLEVEEEIIPEVECCSNTSNGLTRVPDSITPWSLLTQVTLQKRGIIGMSEAWSNNITGISILKSVAEFDCKRVQPLIDIRISLDKAVTRWGGHNDSAAATNWDVLDIDIWQPLAGGFYVHAPIRLNLESISFMFWSETRRIRRGS